jgi:Rrf2 family protein
MIKLNKKVEYGLMILKHFEEKTCDSLTSAREICDLYNTPFDTTAKVMQILNSASILESVKGVRGGYTLNKDLSSISYLALTELIEGRKVGPTCAEQNCTFLGSCNISSPVQKLNERLKHFFENLTVKDLLGENIKSIPNNEAHL